MDEECNREVAERGEVVASFATSDAVVSRLVVGMMTSLFTVASHHSGCAGRDDAGGRGGAGEEKFRVTQYCVS